MVVADPVGNVAEMISTQCRRLAKHRVVATSGNQALNLVREWRPQIITLSLEIGKPSADKLLPQLTEAVPESLIVGTYRKLSSASLEQFGRLGVDAFLAHPIAATELFRVVSQRFGLPCRQFQRFVIDLAVHSSAGAALGTCLDISEGGLRFAALTPLQAEEQLELALPLPDGVATPLQLPCRVLGVHGRDGKHLVRCQFAKLSAEDHSRLTAYIASLSRKLDGATY